VAAPEGSLGLKWNSSGDWHSQSSEDAAKHRRRTAQAGRRSASYSVSVCTWIALQSTVNRDATVGPQR
jgi:hypothetical protein